MKLFRMNVVLAVPVFLFSVFVAPHPSCLAAGNEIRVIGLEAYPTFESIGLRLSFDGDNDSNATTAVRYRVKGTNRWRPAQPLSRIRGNRFAGSILFLDSGNDYEVEITLTDPGGRVTGGRQRVAVATRSDLFPIGGGRQYYVGPRGDDSDKGTSLDKPFRTIGKAAGLVRPGDVVWVLPGVYREQVKITRSGNKDAYIAFRARGKGVILSGADPDYDRLENKENWRHEKGPVYSTDPPYRTRYVAANGVRLYHYLTRAEFDTFICGSPGGWYQDEKEGRLYVRLSSGDDPGSGMMQLAILDTGFHLEKADYILIEGFEIREYGKSSSGAGIHLDRAAWCVIRSCSIHGMKSKVRLSGARAEGNLIEKCELWDSSLSGWPWAMTVGHDEAGAGIMSTTGGRGNVVRSCRMHGLFDGLAPSFWDSLWVESYNCDWDVYDNEISHLRDDVIEPEGPCINFRFWNNYCHDIFTGVSLAPINVGPIYIMYNVLFDENWLSLKYGVFSQDETFGRGICFLYHNTFYCKKPKVNMVIASRPLAGQVFRNNIFLATGYPFWTSKEPLPTNDIDYNDWYTFDTDWSEIYTGTPHKRFFRFPGKELYFLDDLREAMGWEMHGLQADPLFVDPGSGDLRLRHDSPCIDRGEVLPNINDGFSGEAPDMGAYETGSPFRGRFPLGKGQ